MRRALARELSGHVHQAAEIAGEQRIGAPQLRMSRLLLDDGVGDLAVFDRECAAKAAADLVLGHLDELQALSRWRAAGAAGS